VTIALDYQAVGTSANAMIEEVLQEYGLQSLTHWVWGEITSGADTAQILLDMYQTPQFKARFPGIFERQAKGLPAVSPGDYVNYEDSLAQLESQYHITQGVLTGSKQVAAFIGGDTSIQEVQNRVQNVYAAVNTYPPEVQQFWHENYGHGSLLSWALDENTALPILEQQATAAQIGGTGAIAGINLSGNTAMRLAQIGVSASQAQNQFQNLNQQQDLFQSSVSEQPGLAIGEQGVNAAFGLDATAQQQITEREAQRKAEFAGAGSGLIDQYGAPGAGAAKTA
jgi:hypothetical protein